MKNLAIFLLVVFISPCALASEYRVGSGDILGIEILDETELTGEYPVTIKGTIRMFLLGDVKVSALTTEEIADKLRTLLTKDYIRNPQVKVLIKEYNSHKIYVLGEVSKPGTYHLKEKNTIMDILLEAGGPSNNAGDLLSILRTESADGKENLTHIPVNVTKLFIHGDMTQNVKLYDRDIIYMSRRDRGDITSRFFEKEMNIFFVVGEVKKPGSYEYRNGYTVLNAILDAGGITEYASPNRTKLIRGEGKTRQTFYIKIGDITEKGKTELDIPIKSGDLIIVPASIF
ncbi:MAG TPA: SLBB domain-containing protein [bacterium]